MPKGKYRRKGSGEHKYAAMGICGVRTQAGTPCKQKAGWGTTHEGIGKCKFHGGRSPNNRKNAIKQQAIFMGAPVDINPLDAIIWCIKITAGEVQFLSEQIAAVSEENWIENTMVGKQMHIFQRARADAQDRLVRYSKEAISLGLAERAVRLAEQFGTTIATLLKGIAADVELTASQQKRWTIAVRKHLILMEGGMVVEQDDRRNPLRAIEGTAVRRNGSE